MLNWIFYCLGCVIGFLLGLVYYLILKMPHDKIMELEKRLDEHEHIILANNLNITALGNTDFESEDE